MNIKRLTKTITITALSAFMFSGYAMADPASVEISLKEKNPAIKIVSVKEIYNGPVYEVIHQAGPSKQIVYVSGDASKLILGEIIDLNTGSNITKDRVSEINPIDWNSLPLENAVKSGSGPLKVAIFSDPECPYCVKLEKMIGSLEGVTVYTFLYPLESIHPDSKRKSISIMCSKDPKQELINVMLLGKKTSISKDMIKDCDGLNIINSNIQIGRNLGINGTPTLISGDGRKSGAYPTVESMKAWLENKIK